MSSIVNINVVGTANFSKIYAELAKLNTAMSSMSSKAITKDLAAGLKTAETQFLRNVSAIKGANLETVRLQSATDRLTKSLVQGKFRLNEYMNVWRGQKDMLAKLDAIAGAQARVAKSLIIPSSTRQGYAHLIEGLNKTGIASEQAAIRQRVLNTALRDGTTSLLNFGKNTQWAGRQLTAGLTMPMVMLGAAISKVFYDVDKELTKLGRVYGAGIKGATTEQINAIKKDVISLSQVLSKSLGISSQEVASLAADFAQAGQQGAQLLKSTAEASKIMVLGETDKQEAVKATIAIQNTYKLNNEQLTESINFLNTVQDSTSTSFKDLIDAVPRVGPIIKNLGGTYKDTAAMLVAMKEGGVSVAEGANALKNSFGRMINPTAAAVAMLGKFNIHITDLVAKNAQNPTQLILDLQQALDKLDPLTRSRAIAELFGKFQFARMTALFDNFNKTGSQSAMVMGLMGASAKELANTTDRHISRIQQSTSGKFKIAIESLKAQLLPLGEKFLKAFTVIIHAIEKVVKGFNKLGFIKDIIMSLFAGGAVVGPIIMITGLIANMTAQIMRNILFFKMFAQGFRQGIGAGGGIFSAFRAGLEETRNFFQEIDKSLLASQKLSQIITSEAISQEEVVTAMSKAVAEFTLNIERLRQVSGGAAVPLLNPAFLSTGGVRSPGSIITAASQISSPHIVGIQGSKIEGGRYGIRTAEGGTVEALHFSPYAATYGGTNVLNTPGYNPARNALGNLTVFPSTITETGSREQMINQAIGEKQMPVLPPRLMNDENIKSLMAYHGIAQNSGNLAASKNLFSLETLSANEVNRLTAMRAATMLNEAQLSILKSVSMAPGVTPETITGTLKGMLGAEYEKLEQATAKQILGLYEQAEREVLSHPMYAGAGFVEQTQTISARMGELLREQYNITIDSMDKEFANGLILHTDKVGQEAKKAIMEAFRKNINARIFNIASQGEAIGLTIFSALEEIIAMVRQEVAMLAEGMLRGAKVAGAAGAMSRVGAISRGPMMFADGGHVRGPGSGTSDSIPAYLSNGEYVIKASSVSKYGTGFLDGINTQKFGTGGPVYDPYNWTPNLNNKSTFAHMAGHIPLTPAQANNIYEYLSQHGSNSAKAELAAWKVLSGNTSDYFYGLSNFGFKIDSVLNSRLNTSGVSPDHLMQDLELRFNSNNVNKNPYRDFLKNRLGISEWNNVAPEIHAGVISGIKNWANEHPGALIKDLDLYKFIPNIVEKSLISKLRYVEASNAIAKMYGIEGIRTNKITEEKLNSATASQMEEIAAIFGGRLRQKDNGKWTIVETTSSGRLKGSQHRLRQRVSNIIQKADAAIVERYSSLIDIVNPKSRIPGGFAGLKSSFMMEPFASGGKVIGAGSGKSDSIPAMLSNGEYVVKADSVAKYGTGFLDAVNTQRFANGGFIRGFGGGGWNEGFTGPSMENISGQDAFLRWTRMSGLNPESKAFATWIATNWTEVRKNRELSKIIMEGTSRFLPEGMELRRATVLNAGVSGEFSPRMTKALQRAIAEGNLMSLIGKRIKWKSFASFADTTRRFMSGIDIGGYGEGFPLENFHRIARKRIAAGEVPVGKMGLNDVFFNYTTGDRSMGRDISAYQFPFKTKTSLQETLMNKPSGTIESIASDLATRKLVFMIRGAKNGGLIPRFAGGGLGEMAMFEEMMGDIAHEMIGGVKVTPFLENALSMLPRERAMALRNDPEQFRSWSEGVGKHWETSLTRPNPAMYRATRFLPHRDPYAPMTLAQAERMDATLLAQMRSNENYKKLNFWKEFEIQMGMRPRFYTDILGNDTPYVNWLLEHGTTAQISEYMKNKEFKQNGLGFAWGGKVFGAGGPTDDKIPAYLSNGEYVVNAGAVNKYGVGFMDAVNAGKFADGGIAGYAGGGIANTSSNSMWSLAPIAFAALIPLVWKLGKAFASAETSMSFFSRSTKNASVGSNITPAQSSNGPGFFSRMKNNMDERVAAKYGDAGYKGMLKKGFGFSFGAMMVGQGLGMASSTLAKAPGALGEGLAGAATGASMGSMFGPAGMAIGAGIGAIYNIWDKENKKAAERARVTAAIFKESYRISGEDAAMFGIKIKDLSSNLTGVAKITSAAATAIDNYVQVLNQQYQGGGEMKDYLDSLKPYKDDLAGLAEQLQERLNTETLMGVSAKDANIQMAAMAKYLGVDLPASMLRFNSAGKILRDSMSSPDKFGANIVSMLKNPNMNENLMRSALLSSGYKFQSASQKQALSDSIIDSLKDVAPEAYKTLQNAEARIGLTGKSLFDSVNSLSRLSPAIDMFKSGFMNAPQMLTYLAASAKDAAKTLELYKNYTKDVSSLQATLQKEMNKFTVSSSLSNDKASIQKKIDNDKKLITQQQNQIKANEKRIKQEQKEMDLRNRAFEQQSKAVQQQTELNNLQQDVMKAKASGNLIDIALAEQSAMQGAAEQARQNAKDAADARNQAVIDRLSDVNTGLSESIDKENTAIDKLTTALGKIDTKINDGISKAMQSPKYLAVSGLQELITHGGLSPSVVSREIGKNAPARIKSGTVAEKMKWYLDNYMQYRDQLSAADIATATNIAFGQSAATSAAARHLLIDPTANPKPKDKIKYKTLQGWIVMTYMDDRHGWEGTMNIGGHDSPMQLSKEDMHNAYIHQQARMAIGGFISGPGGPMSDMIPAMLSNGEYIIRASSVQKYGIAMLDAINKGNFGAMSIGGQSLDGMMPSYNVPSMRRPSEGFASSSNAVYNVTVNVASSNANPNDIADAVKKVLAENQKRADGLSQKRFIR